MYFIGELNCAYIEVSQFRPFQILYVYKSINAIANHQVVHALEARACTRGFDS